MYVMYVYVMFCTYILHLCYDMCGCSAMVSYVCEGVVCIGVCMSVMYVCMYAMHEMYV